MNSNPLAVIYLLTLFCSHTAIADETKKQEVGNLIIQSYKVEIVEICDDEWNCKDIPVQSLPTPPVQAIDIDSEYERVAITLEGKRYWIPNMEIETNKKAKASQTCDKQKVDSKQDITATADKKSYVIYGAGEGC